MIISLITYYSISRTTCHEQYFEFKKKKIALLQFSLTILKRFLKKKTQKNAFKGNRIEKLRVNTSRYFTNKSDFFLLKATLILYCNFIR